MWPFPVGYSSSLQGTWDWSLVSRKGPELVEFNLQLSENKIFRRQKAFMRAWKRYAWYSFGLFQVLVFLAAAVKPANAYVDPGSGLLFLQVGGSMLAGAMFVLRAKIRKLFRMGPPPETVDQAKIKAADETGTGPHA
jgi:polyferredoxin